jgi:hypothetical protein
MSKFNVRIEVRKENGDLLTIRMVEAFNEEYTRAFLAFDRPTLYITEILPTVQEGQQVIKVWMNDIKGV